MSIFFVSSMEAAPKEFARAVRSHWGIKNSLHCVLEVTFREDDSRIRTDKESKSSVRGRIKQMAYNESYSGACS